MSYEDEKYKKQFETDYQNSKKSNSSYSQIMQEIIRDYNITVDKFITKTYLSKTTYYNLIEGKRKPELTTVVALAVAFKISLRNIETLLRSIGVGFEHTNRIHHAYTGLIERYSGKSISECNESLQKLDIPEEYWLKDPYIYHDYREIKENEEFMIQN